MRHSAHQSTPGRQTACLAGTVKEATYDRKQLGLFEQESVVERLNELTGGKGVDVVLDGIGHMMHYAVPDQIVEAVDGIAAA